MLNRIDNKIDSLHFVRRQKSNFADLLLRNRSEQKKKQKKHQALIRSNVDKKKVREKSVKLSATVEHSVAVPDNNKMDERRTDRDSDLGDDSPMVSALANKQTKNHTQTQNNNNKFCSLKKYPVKPS